MTQDVLVTISGLHMTEETGMEQENEPIEVVTPAKYYYKNGKHYILYDEVMEGFSEKVKNQVKITGDSQLEIRRTGLTASHMIFEDGKSHLSEYQTPFGTLHTQVHTRKLAIHMTEEQINIDVDYRLEVNGEPTADCRIIMKVMSKKV